MRPHQLQGLESASSITRRRSGKHQHTNHIGHRACMACMACIQRVWAANRSNTVLLRPHPGGTRTSTTREPVCACHRSSRRSTSSAARSACRQSSLPIAGQPETAITGEPTLRHTTPTGPAVPGRSVMRKHVWHDCKRRAMTSPRWLQPLGGHDGHAACQEPSSRAFSPSPPADHSRLASACRRRDFRITGASRSGYSAAIEAAERDGLGFEQRGATSLMGSAPMQG